MCIYTDVWKSVCYCNINVHVVDSVDHEVKKSGPPSHYTEVLLALNDWTESMCKLLGGTLWKKS